VEQNLERFAKRVRPRPDAPGRLILAPAATARDPAAEMGVAARAMDGWPADDGTRAILARTRRELLPAAALALERGIPFRADGVSLLLEDPRLDGILAEAATAPGRIPHLLCLGALAREATRRGGTSLTREATRRGGPSPAGPPVAGAALAGSTPGPAPSDAADQDDMGPEASPLTDLLAALLAWAVAYPTLAALTSAVGVARERLAALRAAEPRLTLATAHSTKGLEFDHVAVIGMSEGRFPSPRALAEAGDPTRALEEERRLAYVAWTRARRSLTLAYEPDSPSRFLVEAFGPDVIGAGGADPVRP
jgi:superfamily I DNA/RNA helicase